jgi:hypothetical protein
MTGNPGGKGIGVILGSWVSPSRYGMVGPISRKGANDVRYFRYVR